MPGRNGGDRMDDRATGRVQVYTGNGKGKTTAAIGLAVRAACAGMRVYVGQMMKGGAAGDYSELCLRDRFEGLVTIEQFGTGRLLCKGESPSEDDIRAALRGVLELTRVAASGDYRIVIADEINVSVHLGLVPESHVLELISARHPATELVLTGRYAPAPVIDAADLVTEMRAVRHYYDTEGLSARKGIEF